jgi:glycosyltransferase involved in cell wall biosynthesis
MTDIEWREARGRCNRAASLASTYVCCFTNEEIKRYSRQYGIPQDKFMLVLDAFQHSDQKKPSDDGFVFAGGIQNRDWDTFFKAVDGLPCPVRVFTNQKLESVPSNTSLHLVGRDEYYSQMAAASCVVVPVGAEPLRINGIATWTNAMAMGKVVIATEPLGAPDYMEQGVSGFYVKYGDVDALRACIEKVMGDPELRRRMGAAARERAHREFSPEVFKRRILALLENHPDAAPET